MKVLVENYTFDASEKTVTLTDYNPVVMERLLLITNVTDGIIIYKFADATKGGTALTNVITLVYDTTSMSDTDDLQIFYDHAAATQLVSGTVTANLGATDNAVLDDIAANQTDASQKTQVVDGAGNVIGATANALDINIKSGNPTTIAVTQGTATNLKAQAEVYQGGAAVAIGNPLQVTLPAATVVTLTPPAAITGFATEATLSALNAKLVTGTDIGDVTINNGAGAAAVNIQDGGNAITVDGTVAVTGTFWQATQPVSLASVPPHEVTNAGTFAVQADTELTTADLDTGVGTDTRAVVGLVGTASGGGQLIPGSSTDGLLVNLGANNDVTITSGTITTITNAVTVNSHAVTNAGTFAVQVDGAALTALQLIDDAVAADGTAYGKGVLMQGDDGTDRRAILVGTDGHLQVDVLSAPSTAVTNAGITTIAGAVAGTEMQVDVVGALPAGTNSIGVVGHNITGIGHGVKVVATAGTDEALAGSTACKRITIQAQTDNTSVIAVGGSGVDATIATGTGVLLYPGDVFEMDIDNLADVYIDSLVNGEGVRFTYFT